MQKIFYIYEVEGRKVPYVAREELPDPWIREMRKFDKGRKTQVEAIRRTLGVNLDPRLPAAEISEFLSQNLYGTKKWNVFIRHKSDVENEVQMIEFKTKLLYKLKVETDRDVEFTDILLLPKIEK